jgi:hypothetical protein
MSLPIIYPSGVGKHTMDAIPNSMFQPLDRSLPFLLPWSCNPHKRPISSRISSPLALRNLRIVCREVRPGPKKDRWHPLYTTSAGAPEDLLHLFRSRQNHEQGHRVEVHDLLVDAAPCGYDKDSPDRQRPRFHRGPLQMIGWLVALVYNAVADLAETLGPDHVGDHVRTLRRKFFNRPGQLYETPEALIVYLDPFKGQDELEPVIDKLNAGHHRLPWLDNRRLVMSLTPRGQARPGP